jgi:fructokinase
MILGGGVMQQQSIFPLVRAELIRLLNGYVRSKDLLENVEQYVVPPKLGNRAGIAGALVLAEQAYHEQQEGASIAIRSDTRA